MLEGSYFLCARSETAELIERANREAQPILDELKFFLCGNIGIRVYAVEHVMGYSIAGDLTVNDEVCRAYDPVDLCFLGLNEMMLKKLAERMGKRV